MEVSLAPPVSDIMSTEDKVCDLERNPVPMSPLPDVAATDVRFVDEPAAEIDDATVEGAKDMDTTSARRLRCCVDGPMPVLAVLTAAAVAVADVHNDANMRCTAAWRAMAMSFAVVRSIDTTPDA
jgi:hypothetical protein